MRTINIPVYILSNETLNELVFKAKDIMTELAGERETPELPILIRVVENELKMRNETYSMK